MKIFLKNSETAEYLRCDSTWTLNINEALDFLTVRRAVSFGIAALRGSFQVMGMETEALPGSIRIAISNLLWPEDLHPALYIATRDIPPQRERALEPAPNSGNLMGRNQNPQPGECRMASAPRPVLVA